MVEIVFEPIIPKKFDPQVFLGEFESALKVKTKPELQRLFRGTVQGWKNKPDFSGKFTRGIDSMSMFVYPSGRNAEQYKLVTLGSPAHDIFPKNMSRLVFQRGYSPASAPRRLVSVPARRFGPRVSARMVRHPGFEAREFDYAIAEHYAPDFYNTMAQANLQAVRKL